MYTRPSHLHCTPPDRTRTGPVPAPPGGFDELVTRAGFGPGRDAGNLGMVMNAINEQLDGTPEGPRGLVHLEPLVRSCCSINGYGNPRDAKYALRHLDHPDNRELLGGGLSVSDLVADTCGDVARLTVIARQMTAHATEFGVAGEPEKGALERIFQEACTSFADLSAACGDAYGARAAAAHALVSTLRERRSAPLVEQARMFMSQGPRAMRNLRIFHRLSEQLALDFDDVRSAWTDAGGVMARMNAVAAAGSPDDTARATMAALARAAGRGQ